VLDLATFQHCVAVADALLERGFAGDFDRMLAWWRLEKHRFAQAEPAPRSAAETRCARPPPLRRGGTIGVRLLENAMAREPQPDAEYMMRDTTSHPPRLHAAYKTSVLRSPRLALISLQQSLPR
jgi:hypothetical protein